MPTLIYLIGFMGSGKSTLGHILANVLGFDFVDLDDVLEERLGRPIWEYFQVEGEEAFRKAEHALVEETIVLKNTVVAAGGGAFLVDANRDLMRENGLTVYLRLSVSLLVTRLSSSRHRPLLFGDDGVTLSGEALRERIERLLAERTPYYEEADVIVDIDTGPIGSAVDRLEAEIQAWEKKPG